MLIYTNWSRSICFSLYFFVLNNLNKDVKVVISVCNLKYKYLEVQSVLPRSRVCVGSSSRGSRAALAVPAAALELLFPASALPAALWGTHKTAKPMTGQNRGFGSALVFLGCCIKKHF